MQQDSISSFPPSSPVLDPEDGIVPKGLLISNTNKHDFEYPTPNPSSSLGYIPSEGDNKENVAPKSSPNNSPSKKVLPKKVTVTVDSVNSSSDIPRDSFEKQVKRVSKVLKINRGVDQTISVGRSSKLCEFGLNPHNKLISRRHCVISYDCKKELVKLECQGWNGLNVTIPRRVSVKSDDKADGKTYLVEVTKTAKSNDTGRVLFEDPQFTNFYILRGEAAIIPSIKDTVIDIRGEIILLDYEGVKPSPPKKQVKPTKEIKELKHTKSGNEVKQVKAAKHTNPGKHTSASPTPSAPHKRIRKSYIRKEEKEEKYEFEHMTPDQVEEVLEDMPGLDEVTHVVANHIAYSRLLQVPLTDLLNLNPVKERGLSRLQLRCILVHHLACIGVIYRTGTDAAGLPLDEEYYYIPEKDDDKARVQLVEELKGSASHLRSCRKTHKQYFWKKPKK